MLPSLISRVLAGESMRKNVFVTQEKRAWMRLRSHTVVFERDPDYARYLADQSGSVLSVLRIWVADTATGPAEIRHYLGSVRHCACGGWMSREELFRLFRQATVTACLVGESTSTFRASLSHLLRKHFGEEKTSED
jgi:hypothetical protein